MLEPVRDVVSGALDRGQIPGAVVLVCADGELVHADARGVAVAGGDAGLELDSVFWLASLSKVVCAATALTLVADGLIDLDDPVSKFVPEFGRDGVIRVPAAGSAAVVPQPPWAPPPDPMPVWDLVPAQRELTLRHLLTHTSGLQSIFLYNADYRRPQSGDTLATHVPTLARVPRDFEAGTAWAYSNAAAFDVVARMLEVAAGETYDKLVGGRVCGPLGLTDLGFGLQDSPHAVPADVRSTDDPVIHAVGGYHSAAAGMWGSMRAYLVFAELLRTGGLHAGRRVLDAGLTRQMTSNQVGDLCPGINGRPETRGVGGGFSVAVLVDPAAAESDLPAGTFGWDGVNTRRFWSSPNGWSITMYLPDDAAQRAVESAVAAALG